MGNRAVITISDSKTAGTGIYLHWNGGLESVLAFLAVCESRDYRTPGTDEYYALARLTGVCHEFFTGGLSLGVGPLKQLDCDNFDNGVYVIGPGWEIKARWGKGSEPRTRVGQLTSEEKGQMRTIIGNLTGHVDTPPAE